MNAIFFGLKRSYQAPLKMFNRLLAADGMTCARFDLMHAVRTAWGISQKRLRQVLGVSGATVSRMLRSLEGLGLIRREPFPGDGRQRYVRLTLEGLRRYQKVRASGSPRALWRATLRAVHPQAPRYESVRVPQVEAMATALDGFRTVFRDEGRLLYRWHPTKDRYVNPITAPLGAGARAILEHARRWVPSPVATTETGLDCGLR